MRPCQTSRAPRMGGAEGQVDKAIGSNEFLNPPLCIGHVGSLPMRCLVAISQALAALTCTSVVSSSIAARAASLNCGSLAHHHSRAWVSRGRPLSASPLPSAA